MRALRAFTVVVLALGLTAAACGGGGGGSESPAQAQTKIKSAYANFFDPSKPLSEKTALIENGNTLQACLQTQSTNPQIKTLGGAQVVDITLQGNGKAVLKFNLLSAGSPPSTVTPAPFPGSAVKQNGSWKVTLQTFNYLLGLGGTHC
jgi:hypothetical protein